MCRSGRKPPLSEVTASTERHRSGRPRAADRIAHPETAQASFASTPAIRRKMQGQRARDTRPELAFRRHLHAIGLRYRVDHPPLPGVRARADVVFTRVKVAVFVDGCFWHSCPDHGKRPRANQSWWNAKLDRNEARDIATDRRLTTAGWIVVRVWEHEDPRGAASQVEQLVRARRAATGPVPGSTGHAPPLAGHVAEMAARSQ